MSRRTAGALQRGDKVRSQDTAEVIALTYVGRGTIRGAKLIQWNEDGGGKAIDSSAAIWHPCCMIHKRLTMRLTNHWNSLRGGLVLPQWEHFDIAKFDDIWQQCCG